MAGRPKVKIYQYDADFKYLGSYDTQNEVFEKYFNGKKGRLFHNPHYRELPDGTFVSTYRIGREGLLKWVAIQNDVLCRQREDYFPICFYNLRGEKIASFSSIRIASELTGISYSTIQVGLDAVYHGSDGILMRRDLDFKQTTLEDERARSKEQS